MLRGPIFDSHAFKLFIRHDIHRDHGQSNSKLDWIHGELRRARL